MSITYQALIESITSQLGSSIQKTDNYAGDFAFYIKKDSFMNLCRRLKQDFLFTYIIEVTAVDYLGKKEPRYEMVYILHRFGENYDENHRIILKVELEESDASIDSVTRIWKGAEWLEREVYDMFGIEFKGHPDPRRILMPEDYEPNPMRKDFDVRNRQPSKECFEKEMKEGIGH